MNLRTLLFWPHLVIGVLAGGVILLMSVTGVLLTYERQMVAWSNGHLRSEAPAAGGSRLSMERLLTNLQRSHPDVRPVTITVGAEFDAPVIIGLGTQRDIYVDAYSGRVLGEGNPRVRSVMSTLRSWHRWLAAEGDARMTARAITGWSNVLFALLVLSGVYLWFPRHWSWAHVRPVLFFGSRTGKARDFNWHNVIGIWSAVPLFVVVVSAIPISFPWGNALVYKAVGDEPPAARGRGPGPAGEAARTGEHPRGAGPERVAASGSVRPFVVTGLDARLERAEAAWRTITFRPSPSPGGPMDFAIDTGDGGQPQHRSTLTVGADGHVLSHQHFADQSPGRQIRSIMRFAHTGEVLGIPGQTVAGVVSAGGAVLVWTGIALALRRGLAWRHRRRTAYRTAARPAA